MRKTRTKLLEKNDNPTVTLELGSYICPYEDCGKEFGKPIVITNKSVDPPQTYFGCPYCLSRIDVETPEIEKVEQTSKLVEIKKIIEKNVKKSKKKEIEESKCPYHFGYLKEKPKEVPIPEECLICPKMLDCMM